MAETRQEPAQPLRRREATPEDAAVIVGWFPTLRDAVWWGGPTVPDPLTADWLAEQIAAGFFWVWIDQKDVVQAVAGLKPLDGDAYLNRFGMAPVQRGRGLSARLMTELIEIARARGDTTMSLWVYGSNRTARRVYDRWGFQIVDQREACEDASGVSLKMRLELAPKGNV
jgi:ribosomal protein S18 acetylase RimI-like enzyme